MGVPTHSRDVPSSLTKVIRSLTPTMFSILFFRVSGYHRDSSPYPSLLSSRGRAGREDAAAVDPVREDRMEGPMHNGAVGSLQFRSHRLLIELEPNDWICRSPSTRLGSQHRLVPLELRLTPAPHSTCYQEGRQRDPCCCTTRCPLLPWLSLVEYRAALYELTQFSVCYTPAHSPCCIFMHTPNMLC